MFPQAEPAKSRTRRGDQPDHPVRITMNQAGDGTEPLFIERISDEIVGLEFPPVGYTLAPDGIARLLYEAQIIGTDPHGKPPTTFCKALMLTSIAIGQFFRAANAGGKRSLPLFHVAGLPLEYNNTNGLPPPPR